MDPALEGLGDVLIGFLLVTIGLLAIALSLYRRRAADELLASFGAFSFLYGIRLALDSPLAQTLGVSTETADWLTSFITYVILVPAWYFFWKLVDEGESRPLLLWLRFLVVFAVVGIASDLLLGRPESLARANNVIAASGSILMILVLWGRRRRMTTELRILILGLLVFGLLSINDNLVPLGVLPWSWRKESIGFVVFVACLGWIAARRFVATERSLAAVEGELEAAKRIQTSILPQESPTLESLDIAFRFQPSSEVAGDLFEFLEVSPSKIGFVIADVSGHGVPAALIASMVKVAIAASGGHPHPFLHRKSEPSAREVGGGGVILGRFPDAEYSEERLELESGDRFVLYTDGVIEAHNSQQGMFGEQRLRQLVSTAGDSSAEGLCQSVMQEIGRWTGESATTSQGDDLTLVVVEFRPQSPTAER